VTYLFAFSEQIILCTKDAQVCHASPIAEGDRCHQGALARRRHVPLE
jgi:hypothetical protein